MHSDWLIGGFAAKHSFGEKSSKIFDFNALKSSLYAFFWRRLDGVRNWANYRVSVPTGRLKPVLQRNTICFMESAMNQHDTKLLQSVSQLANCNPFSEKRFQLEKEILGKRFVGEDAITWNRSLDNVPGDRSNVILLTDLASELVERIKSDVAGGDRLAEEFRQRYWNVVSYVLLYRHITPVPYQLLWGAVPSLRLQSPSRGLRFKRISSS
jgi:hypothetical protein